MATSVSFKQSCPSCEHPVPIRDPKLIGRKIDCPKCKYRFVVEEPGDDEDAKGKKKGDTAVTGKKPTNGKAAAGKKPMRRRDEDDDDDLDGAPKNKKGGLSPIVIAGIGLAAIAVLGMGITLVLWLTGGDDPPKKETTTKPPAPAVVDDKNDNKEGVNLAADGGTGGNLSIPTNLLPNDCEIVRKADWDKLLLTDLGDWAFDRRADTFRKEAFEAKFGFKIENVARHVQGQSVRQDWIFNVLRTKSPIDRDKLKAGLVLVKGPRSPIEGKEYFVVKGELDAFSRYWFTDLYMFTSPTRTKPQGVWLSDDTTLVLADLDILEKVLQKAPAIQEQPTPPPANNGGAAGPGQFPGGGPPGGMQPPGGSQPPGGFKPPGGGPSGAGAGAAPGGAKPPGGSSTPHRNETFQAPGGRGPGGGQSPPGGGQMPPGGMPPGGMPPGGMPPGGMPGGGMPGMQPGGGQPAAPSTSWMTVKPTLKRTLDRLDDPKPSIFSIAMEGGTFNSFFTKLLEGNNLGRDLSKAPEASKGIKGIALGVHAAKLDRGTISLAVEYEEEAVAKADETDLNEKLLPLLRGALLLEYGMTVRQTSGQTFMGGMGANGGMPGAGFQGGMPGGVQGGMPAGFQGGMPAGFQGGMAGGMQGGMRGSQPPGYGNQGSPGPGGRGGGGKPAGGGSPGPGSFQGGKPAGGGSPGPGNRGGQRSNSFHEDAQTQSGIQGGGSPPGGFQGGAKPPGGGMPPGGFQGGAPPPGGGMPGMPGGGMPGMPGGGMPGMPGGGMPGMPGGGIDPAKDSTVGVTRQTSLICVTLDLAWNKQLRDSIEDSLIEAMVMAKAATEMGGNRPRLHELAAALNTYVQNHGAFPQGASTANSRSSASSALAARPAHQLDGRARPLPPPVFRGLRQRAPALPDGDRPEEIVERQAEPAGGAHAGAAVPRHQFSGERLAHQLPEDPATAGGDALRRHRGHRPGRR